MNELTCDLLVLGGGPGGYTAAIRAAGKGLTTILVENNQLGGTCLNRGCIPTKTLLEDTGLLTRVRQCHFLRGDMKVSRQRINLRKTMVMAGSREWIKNVLLGKGVEIIDGRAFFTGPKTVEIEKKEGEAARVTAGNIIVATGARDCFDPEIKPDGRAVINTDEALNLEGPVKTLAIVGAGNRGLEFASIYHNLGTRVILIEKERRILPRFDKGISARRRKILIDSGIKVRTRTTVLSARTDDDGQALLKLAAGKGPEEIKTEKALIIPPRRPYYQDLRLEAAGLNPDDPVISTGKGGQTDRPGIYVIGDAAGPPYLAHKAISQAMTAVDHLLDPTTEVGHGPIASCVYGDLELAGVGLTEQELRDEKIDYKTGEFHVVGNGRAGTMGRDKGLVRMYSEPGTGKILGVHIMGPGATEMIALAGQAMTGGLKIDQLKKTVYPHPSLSETFFEAALATDGEAIHLLMEGIETDNQD